MAEGSRVAVHPDAHVVAAYARQCARAFGNSGGGVVRTARTEPGLAIGRYRGRVQFSFFGIDDGDTCGDAGAHLRRQLELLEPPGDGLGDQCRRELAPGGQQPLAAWNRPLATGIVFLVELAIDLGAYVVAPVVKLFL